MKHKFLILLFGCFTLATICTSNLSAQAKSNADSSTKLPIEYFTKGGRCLATPYYADMVMDWIKTKV